MIELYVGDGKGKTTASVGLAVRAAGEGIPVLFTQLLKSGTSGEVTILRSLPGVEILMPEAFFGFVRNMNEEQKAELHRVYADLLDQIRQTVDVWRERERGKTPVKGVLIMDEAVHAVNFGFIDCHELCQFLDSIPEDIEVVLTGRNPKEELKERADYISEICCRRHPYERGIKARKGIEF